MSTISLKSIGPIEEFSYEMKSPGLHVLYGNPGSGKTTILRTIQLATDGRTDVKPTKRDGSKKGEAEVLGKTIKIGRVVREEGELELDGMGELDLATLHSPKYKDAKTRDNYRIKTLARLAGAEADVSLFYDLLGGKDEFMGAVDVETVQSDDLVEMSGKVKRSIEKLALVEEKKSETAKANRQAKHDQTEGVDLDAPHDESELSESLSKAVSHQSRLQQQKEDADQVIEDARKAREQLESHESVSFDAANAVLGKRIEERDECQDEVDELKRKLSAAESRLSLAEEKVQSARDSASAARRHEEMTANWRSSIEAAENVQCPSGEELQAAADAVQQARKAQETGMQVRAALKAKGEADKYAAEAKKHGKLAENYRKASKSTADVITDAIERLPKCPLKVWHDEDGNPRLTVSTDRSEHEPFDELSDGERWRMILPMAFRGNRVVVLSQAAFGEIGPRDRELIDELSRQHLCYVVTAQVDDGELRGVPYSEIRSVLEHGKAFSLAN